MYLVAKQRAEQAERDRAMRAEEEERQRQLLQQKQREAAENVGGWISMENMQQQPMMQMMPVAMMPQAQPLNPAFTVGHLPAMSYQPSPFM